MFSEKKLEWKISGRELELHTPVFDVMKLSEESETGIKGDYVAIEAPDWVVIVAVHGDNFVLVRQWRHGEGRVTLEFPGGVCEKDEDPQATALRELEEETGFRAGKMTNLARVSANPALFANHFNVFLAEELTATHEQHLDEDEILNFEEHPINEVIENYGDEYLTHAYMGTALACYFRELRRRAKD